MLARPALFATLLLVQAAGAHAQGSRADMRAVLLNELGLMEYCQGRGDAGADAVQAQARRAERAPNAPVDASQALGRRGEIAVGAGGITLPFARAAEALGVTQAERCRTLAKQVVAAAGPPPGPRPAGAPPPPPPPAAGPIAMDGLGAAFLAEFLRQRVLAEPGVRVPRPTPAEQAAFGPHGADYTMILAFHDALGRLSAPLGRASELTSVPTVSEAVARRTEFQSLRGMLAQARAGLDDAVRRAEAARAGLQQPPALKPTFDAAFARDVTGVADALRDVMAASEASVAATLALSDFIVARPDLIGFEGNAVRLREGGLQPELQRLIAAHLAKATAARAAREGFAAMLRGQGGTGRP